MEMEEITSFYNNGNIHYRCGTLNNHRYGEQHWWYENGNKSDEFQVIDNMRTSLYKKWNSDGFLTHVTQWKNNEWHGLKIIFKNDPRKF